MYLAEKFRMVGAVGERRRSRPLVDNPLDVRVRENRLAREQLAFGKERPVLRDERMPAENDVRRAFPVPRVRVEVRRHRLRALSRDERAPVRCFSDYLVRRAEVHDDGRAGKGRFRGGGERNPQVLAQLDGDFHVPVARACYENVRPERDFGVFLVCLSKHG